MNELDARGLSCPEPVLRTRTALEGLPPGSTLTVVVDTATSRDNVLRTVQALRYEAETVAFDEGYRVTIRKPLAGSTGDRGRRREG
jgi:TusA-related sulfurtransferase